jgi:hypothetical protein
MACLRLRVRLRLVARHPRHEGARSCSDVGPSGSPAGPPRSHARNGS